MTVPHSSARCRAVAAVAVQELRRQELFQYDVIYKTPSTPGLRTSVRRTLLGVAGITYKYLGIRPSPPATRGSGGEGDSIALP